MAFRPIPCITFFRQDRRVIETKRKRTRCIIHPYDSARTPNKLKNTGKFYIEHRILSVPTTNNVLKPSPRTIYERNEQAGLHRTIETSTCITLEEQHTELHPTYFSHPRITPNKCGSYHTDCSPIDEVSQVITAEFGFVLVLFGSRPPRPGGAGTQFHLPLKP